MSHLHIVKILKLNQMVVRGVMILKGISRTKNIRTMPLNMIKKKTLRRLAMNFVLDGEILYKRHYDQTLLRCVHAVEAQRISIEVHEVVCGIHANGHKMARQIMRLGYF